MPKYNESRITDTTDHTHYEYAHRVELNNPLGGAPQVVFRTSWVKTDNETGEEVQGDFHRTLQETYTGNEAFNIVDADGNVLGQMDYDTLFASLYSLFFHVASKEDSDELGS